MTHDKEARQQYMTLQNLIEEECDEAWEEGRYDEKIETANRLLQMKKLSYEEIAIGSGLT